MPLSHQFAVTLWIFVSFTVTETSGIRGLGRVSLIEKISTFFNQKIFFSLFTMMLIQRIHNPRLGLIKSNLNPHL